MVLQDCKTSKYHQTKYFGSTRKFLPLGDKTPEGIFLFIQKTLDNLFKFIKTNKHIPARRNSLQCLGSTVVVCDDPELEAAAKDSEFIEIIVFYDTPICTEESILKDLEKEKESWFVISASNSRGEPIIKNFTVNTKDLVNLIHIIFQDSTRPVQELLAYRTDSLRNALILACSKPF